MIITAWAIAWIAVIGACVGSFVNVVCHRLPIIRSYGEYADGKVLADLKKTYGKYTLLSPSSACPCCQAKIPAYLNVPIVGWLMAGGKCKSCGAAISKQYPLIELLFAFAFGMNAWQAGLYPASLMTMPLMSLFFVFCWFNWKYGVKLKGVLVAVVICMLLQMLLSYFGLSAYTQTQL